MSATIIRLVFGARFMTGSDSSDCRDRLSNRSEFLDEVPVLEDSDGERLSGTVKPELDDLEAGPESGFCRCERVEDGAAGGLR
jgi:hypothetical protein